MNPGTQSLFRPSGTTGLGEDDLAASLAGDAPGPVQLPAPSREEALTAIQHAAQAGLFGFGDEIKGGVDAALGVLRGQPWGETYDASTNDARNIEDAMTSAHPEWANRGDVVGGVGSLLMPGLDLLAAGRAAATGGKALKTLRAFNAGAARGAGWSALYGAGTGEGLQGKIESALDPKNLAVGGLLGGALSGLGRMFAKGSPEEKTHALSELGKATELERSGQDPSTIQKLTGWVRNPDNGKWLWGAAAAGVGGAAVASNDDLRQSLIDHPEMALPLVGMIAGKGARLTEHPPLRAAEALEKLGTPANEIRRMTGFERGHDGHWRWEWSNKDTKFNEGVPVQSWQGKLSDLIDEPALFANYPQMKDYVISTRIDQRPPGGTYFGRSVSLRGGGQPIIEVHGRSREELLSTLIHEAQHGIQELEGHHRGSSPASPDLKPYHEEALNYSADVREQIAKEKKDWIDAKLAQWKDTKPWLGPLQAEHLWKQAHPELSVPLAEANAFAQDPGFGAYKMTAGEVEARNASRRSFKSQEWLDANPLPQTEDFPRSRQSLIFWPGPGAGIEQSDLTRSLADEAPAAAGWRQETPEAFVDARARTKRPGFLSSGTPEELHGSKLYTSHDGMVGVGVTGVDIANVFNNGGPKGAGVDAVVHAIENGGRTLDAYDGYLVNLYGQLGFVETGRMKFNPAFAHNWTSNTSPDVVFMRWNGFPGGKEAAVARAKGAQDLPVTPTDKYYDDWDAAKADSLKGLIP